MTEKFVLPHSHKSFIHNFIVFPQDTNYMSPMVFGGKMASEMDICAAMTVRRALYYAPLCQDAVTASMNIDFRRGAKTKDLVILRGEIIKLGYKSLTVNVVGDIESFSGEKYNCCFGRFVFVARDSEENPCHHGLIFDNVGGQQ